MQLTPHGSYIYNTIHENYPLFLRLSLVKIFPKAVRQEEIHILSGTVQMFCRSIPLNIKCEEDKVPIEQQSCLPMQRPLACNQLRMKPRYTVKRTSDAFL